MKKTSSNPAKRQMPKSWLDYYKVANQCVLHISRERKISVFEAENIVMEVVKEHSQMLLDGSAKLAAASLQMLFLDRQVETFKISELL